VGHKFIEEMEQKWKAAEAQQRKAYEAQKEELKSRERYSKWVRWIIIGLAGAIGGGWGGRQVLSRKSPPAAPSATPRVDRLGLNAGLSWKYFFVVPVVMAGLIAICLAKGCG
jgi:hypothetical protein